MHISIVLRKIWILCLIFNVPFSKNRSMGDKPSVLRALRSHHMVILRLFSLLLRQTFLYSVICKAPCLSAIALNCSCFPEWFSLR